MKVNWVIDKHILKEPYNNLPSLIQKSGANCSLVEYSRFDDIILTYNNNECVVLYGSINFLKRLKTTYIPGSYGFNTKTSCNMYYPYMPKNMLLNEEGIYTTWGNFISRKDFWYDIFDTSKIFIRPNSGFKTFSGLSIDKDDFEFEINSLTQISRLYPEELLMVAPNKTILQEYRLIIVDKKVVTGSSYSWNNNIYECINSNSHMNIFKYAEKIAELEWQLDTCYVIDIAETNDGLKVIELNSFSSSGLYACDLNLLITSINECAWKEFCENMIL